MTNFIVLTNGNGDDVLLNVSQIAVAQNIGPHGSDRQSYDNLSKRIGQDPVLAEVKVRSDTDLFNVPVQQSVRQILARIEHACQ